MKKNIFIGLLVLTIISMLMVSCSSTSSTSTQAVPTTSAQVPTTQASTSNTPAPTSNTPAPTSITIALGGATSNSIDPSTMGADLAMMGNVFDTLIDFDANSKLIPKLADTWSFSADGKTITFNLKKGAKFSTGDPFTANDVVFSMDRCLKNSPPIQDMTRNVLDHVQAIDDNTVAFVLTQPNVQILYNICDRLFITSKAAYDKEGEDAWANNPIGTGPYKFVKFVAGQSIDLAANDYYWGTKPQIKTAHFVYSPDPNTEIKMLQAGEADMITSVAWSSVASLQQAGFNRTDVVSPHAQGLQFGLKNPGDPWYNVKVRQAINYAIDKDALINQLFAGIPGKANWELPYQLGYNASLQAAYPYDLTKAKQLMQEAGFANGFDMPVYYSPEVTGMKDLADYLSSALKEININVKLNALTFGPQWFDFMRSLGTDSTKSGVLLWEVGGPGGNDPTADLFNEFYGPRGATYSTDQLDALINQAFQTFDDSARAKIIGQAYQMINDAMPYVYILQSKIVYMMKPNVSYSKSDGISAPGGLLKDITIK